MKRKPNVRKTVTVKQGISPPYERRQHNGGVRMEGVASGIKGCAIVNRYRAVWECSLDIYHDHKIINQAEYKAGLRFRQAYHRAALSRSALIERWKTHTSTNTESTMSERLMGEARETLDDEEMKAVTTVCGHGGVIWSEKALDKLRKGLGHLAIKWHSAAIEICE